jgi:hypothetical protein
MSWYGVRLLSEVGTIPRGCLTAGSQDTRSEAQRFHDASSRAVSF